MTGHLLNDEEAQTMALILQDVRKRRGLAEEAEKQPVGDLSLTVDIRLGNDAMQTGDNLADALDKIAAELRDWSGSDPITGATHPASVWDVNGSRVGAWTIQEVAQ